jgi:hypothetical protein
MDKVNIIKTQGGDNFLELQLSVLVFQEGDYFLSYCPSLDLSSYGNSIHDAKEGFDDVMKNFIEDSVKNKTLHEDLIKHGWKINIHNAKKAEPPAQVELNIPAGILKKQFNENWTVPAMC